MSRASTQSSDLRQFGKLLVYARPYLRGWVSIGAMGLLTGGVAIAQPWPVKVIIDQVLAQKTPDGAVAWLIDTLPGASTQGGLLAWAALTSLALFGLSSVIEFRVALSWLHVGQRMVYDLARDLFARLQKRSLSFHAGTSVGDLMVRITTDSFCVYRLVDTLLIGPAKALLLAGIMTFIMVQMNWRLTAVALMAAPLMGGAVFLLRRRLSSASRKKREIEGRIQAHVRQMLSGVQVVQAFGQEDREHERFHGEASAAIKAHQRTVFLTNLSDLWTGMIIAIGTGIILYAGSRSVVSESLTIGGLLVFIAYLTTLQAHFQALARAVTTLQSLRGEADRVIEILEQKPEVREAPDARQLSGVRGNIRFEGVSFGYEPGRPVLRGVDLEAHRGETIAIVGATGAGKTTLVSLVPRFNDPQEGRILLDGQDLRELQIGSLRRNVGVVFQEPYLAPLSVRENIAYGNPKATLEQILEAAESANAHEFIATLPHGYDTILGERGMTLSGGQRQRLSIARAFLKNAPVLIMDEPTSALDAQSEKLLVQALSRLAKGRTTLIIAHRMSTIHHADRIVVLDAGKVIEQGDHNQLMAFNGAYARMYSMQQAAGRADGKGRS